jgi:hypothetical protein
MEKPILYTDEPMVVGEVIPDFPRPDQLSYPPKRRKCGDMQISEDIRLYDEAKRRDEEFFPVDLMKQIMGGQSPMKVYRIYRGLTQQALAEGMGISRSYLAEIEWFHNHLVIFISQLFLLKRAKWALPLIMRALKVDCFSQPLTALPR